MSRLMTKPTKWHVRPPKTQISLGIRPVWSESSLSGWIKFGSLASLWAHSDDFDKTGRMPRLIWVFAGRVCHFVGFVTRRLLSGLFVYSFHCVRLCLFLFRQAWQAWKQGGVRGWKRIPLAGQIISKSCCFEHQQLSLHPYFWPQNRNYLKIPTPL